MTIVTFVVPWYGPDVPGGAEAETRRTAQQLQDAGLTVEVLTTCTRDVYADWGRNYHSPGITTIDGITVRRFPVEPRDRIRFDEINIRLMHGLPIARSDERVFMEQMIRSPELLAFIAANCDDRLFIFSPYLFSTTYYGAQICPERSIIIPCLHDESYAHLDIYQDVLPAARSLAFYASAEKKLADRLFPPSDGQIRTVLGAGVDVDAADGADGERFRRTFGLDGPFVLYAGRREAGKNTPLLLEYWSRFRRQEGAGRDIKLVLIGPGEIQVPDAVATSILDLGFVSSRDKQDAFAAADLFVMPSVHESFSISVMESWLAETPVLVHGACAVTREHCIESNGGLYFDNYDEFAATLLYMLDHPDEAAQMGRQGRQHVLATYDWDAVIPRYLTLFEAVLAE